MKRSLLAGLVVWLYSAGMAQETPAARYDNFFGIGPFDLFSNTLQLCYERQFNNRNSVAVMGGFKLSKKNQAIDRIGANGELQYRVNILYNKTGAGSLAKNYTAFPYFAPYVQYRYEEIATPAVSASYINSCFSGVGFGVRFTGIHNRFTLNIFGGGGIRLSDTHGFNGYDNFMEVGYTGIAPKVSCYMGIVF